MLVLFHIVKFRWFIFTPLDGTLSLSNGTQFTAGRNFVVKIAWLLQSITVCEASPSRSDVYCVVSNHGHWMDTAYHVCHAFGPCIGEYRYLSLSSFDQLEKKHYQLPKIRSSKCLSKSVTNTKLGQHMTQNKVVD